MLYISHSIRVGRENEIVVDTVHLQNNIHGERLERR